MSRQRFIHPEFWTDPTIGKLEYIDRLFFLGCISNADDEGRLLGDPAYLRSIMFPYDDIKIAEVEKIRNRVIATCRNLLFYNVDGTNYLAFRQWSRYQSPRYPKPSRLPCPPETQGNSEDFGVFDDTTKSPQTCNQITANLQPVGDYGLGRDGMGRDGLGLGDSTNKNNAKTKPPKTIDAKHSYAEFVSLTNDEHSSLVAKYGEPGTQRMIEILNNFKGQNDTKYKSDYRAILNWVVERYEKEQAKNTVKKEEKRHPTDFYKVYL